MNIATFDLNLLRTLDALLETGSVSRASEQLNLSQPAVSAALARLRRHLNDPLLIRHGGGMTRTATADDLRPRVRRIIEEIERTLSGSGFDPSTSSRTFRIVASTPAMTFVRPALADLARAAPLATLIILPMSAAVDAQLASGAADLAVGSPWELRRCGSLVWLGEEAMRVVCRTRHPRIAGPLDLETYLAERHILTSPNGRSASFVDSALEAIGQFRQVALTVPDFATALTICASTDHLLTCPDSIIQSFRPRALQSFALPLPAPPLRAAMARHKRSENDPALDWLMSLIAPRSLAQARTLSAGAR